MLHAQALGHQAVLRVDHVVVVVARKFRAQAVGGLARFSVADGVGKDDEVFRGIERLAGAEQLAREGRVSRRLPEPVLPCRTRTGSPVGAPTVV